MQVGEGAAKKHIQSSPAARIVGFARGPPVVTLRQTQRSFPQHNTPTRARASQAAGAHGIQP